MTEKKAIQLFLAGDSTVSDCPKGEEPRAGWGQVLPTFFNENVTVFNCAVGGRSSKSFIEEGRLESIKTRLQPGDYLLIQFGHNDQKEDFRKTEPFGTYQKYLMQYVDAAYEVGATPVLITSMHRRTFDENGLLFNSLGDYPKAMLELAKNKQVTVIDLWTKTKKLYESLGPEESKNLFIWLKPKEHPNYPDGIQDDTHFCEDGALKLAEIIVQEMKEKLPGLAPFILK